jgi:hypothetical protein
MSRTAARRALASTTLLLLAIAATLAFGETVAASRAAGTGSATATGHARRDDVHVVAAAPLRAAEWAIGQQRGPQSTDHLVAVLVAAAVLLLAQGRRRAALAGHRGRAALCAHRSGIRAPPAFV